MKPMDYNEITDFQKVRLFENTKSAQDALFTNMRVKRESIPDGKYAYDLRESDSTSNFVAIEPVVIVNHGGTVICDKEIIMNEKNYHSLQHGRYINFV